MGEYEFSTYKIAEMALGIEDAGVVFYEKLATLAEDERIKNIFIALSKAELKHKDTFRSLADSFRNDNSAEYSIDFSAFMRTHIDKIKEAAFNMQSFSRAPTNIQGALTIAIDTEKEAIRIYTEIHNTFIERFHTVLENIINEEKKHLEILMDLKIQSNRQRA